MDTRRMKTAAEWFYSMVYRDEPIKHTTSIKAAELPSLLRTARSLDNASYNHWQNRETVFLKQGKLLANYEDDYPFDAPAFICYSPTYQSLNDQELRGYFSWRTKVRSGDIQKTSLSFAFLYIYELINQIGTKNPLDGYEKLKAFRDTYGPLDGNVLTYLKYWMFDYVVYYELDVGLLADFRQKASDRSISVLDSIREREDTEIMSAVKQLSPKWLERSKFYASYQADCDTVIVRTLRRVSYHYALFTKKTMVEQLFGVYSQVPARLFATAIFCDPLKKRNCTYKVDERCIYRCRNGIWTVTKRTLPLHPSIKLDDILKTVDAVMREEYAFKHPVKYAFAAKWFLKIVREETQQFLREKASAEIKKLHIDYSQLDKIRQEAAITQDKLTVEEELDEPMHPPVIERASVLEQAVCETHKECLLSEPEYRLLQCLLYNRPTTWIQPEGYLMSVLVDGINEKLYDIFLDNVLDDTPEPIDDYIDDLKEVVKR